MLNRAAGIGKFIRERIAADCLKLALGNIQAIGLDAGQFAAIIIVKSRQIIRIKLLKSPSRYIEIFFNVNIRIILPQSPHNVLPHWENYIRIPKPCLQLLIGKYPRLNIKIGV